MKKLIFILTVIAAISCSDSKSGTDKKAELENLKKEQAEIKSRITKLEMEIASTDSTAGKSKLVGITEINPQLFNHLIEIQAKVDGDKDVLLSTESSGNVTAVHVKPGDRVAAGEVLATIDDKLVMQGIAELQSQLDLTGQIYNKQKNLWDQKIGSEIQFLQAKTNKESMEKRMEVMKQQLNMTRIKSPINGTVDEVDIKVGQTVMPGMPAVRVVNLSSLKVKGEVAESFINRVNKGDDVILFFPDQNKEIKSKIDYSGSRIDPLNRTFNVEVRLQDKQGNFHPNMIAVMKIVDYSNPTAFVVPIDAIQNASDGKFVYVVEKEGKKSVAKRKTVTTGMVYNGLVEIKSGLKTGDQVITRGFQNVIEGDAVGI